MTFEDAPTFGKPSLGLQADLIATILDWLRQAWERVRSSGTISVEDVETTMVNHLYSAMREVKRELRMTFPRLGQEVLTRSKEGQVKSDGRIDLQVIYSFDEDEYFGIECKRVTGKDTALANHYVAEGVRRFVDGKYARGHAWSAMVGFTLDGDLTGSAGLVSQRIHRDRIALALVGDWAPDHVHGGEALYRTTHYPAGRGGPLAMLHLFVPV